MARLTDSQVDRLADALKGCVTRASRVSFENYKLSHDPSRVIGVMRAHDYPRKGAITASTFGLAHETWQDSDFPDRVELVQVWDEPSLDYERIMIAAAESMIMTKRVAQPGTVYANAVVAADLPELALRMPHALMMFPYLWDEGFVKIEVGKERIWFLQVAPVFDDELAFIEKNTFKTFQELLEEDGYDFEELERESHVSR